MDSAAARELRSKLSAVVVGQAEAIDAVVTAMVRYRANLNDPGRPIAAFLLLGPTGSGKTLLAEALAEVLHDARTAVLKLNCAELSSEHELARLKGSPPGYVGWKEAVPLLSETRLKEVRLKDEPAIVLFDEVEKAHPSLWDLLLGLLDKGEVVLNDNTRVDFSKTIVLFTGNVGGKEVEQHLGGGMGFTGATGSATTGIAKAAERVFSTEFRNRLSGTIIFHPLNREQACEVARRELRRAVRRVAVRADLQLSIAESVVEAVVAAGWEPRYGARGIKRAIETLLIDPLSNLLADGRVKGCVVVKAEIGGLVFEQAMAA